jgi:hypothetical protein
MPQAGAAPRMMAADFHQPYRNLPTPRKRDGDLGERPQQGVIADEDQLRPK